MVICLLQLLLQERNTSCSNTFVAFEIVIGDLERTDLGEGAYPDVDLKLI
jgi:hypothetical protein